MFVKKIASLLRDFFFSCPSVVGMEVRIFKVCFVHFFPAKIICTMTHCKVKNMFIVLLESCFVLICRHVALFFSEP